MKSFLLALFLLAGLLMLAAEPTTTASNLSFTRDGGQFSFSFTTGNGNGRIVVVKEGSDIMGTPVDGVNYTAQAAFGTAGSEFTAPGEYVVLKGNISTGTITNLKPGTAYYIAIFEYNTAGTPNPDYSTLTPTNQRITTLVDPTIQATLGAFTLVTGNSVRVNWTNGNGTGRLVVARKGTTLTATPVDTRSYGFSQEFGKYTGSTFTLDAETFVVFNIGYGNPGQNMSAEVTKLEPNTTYTFAVFEYNGNNAPAYLTPGAVRTVTTNTGPTTAPGTITFNTIDGNRLGGYWNISNASRYLVVAKKDGPVTFRPVNGGSYASNAAFGDAATETSPGSGEYIVGNSAANSFAVTNLEKSSIYHFAVFGFDVDANGFTYYLTSSFSQKSQSTAVAPTQNRTLTVTGVTGSSAQLTWNDPAGDGDYRLTVIRDGALVDFVPQDYTKYGGATSIYGTGSLVAPETYTLWGQSNGGAPNITGLTAGHTYHVAVFEMNGQNAPVYLVPGATVSFTIPNEPTAAPTSPSFMSVEGNSMRFDWTNGNGARRIVVARKAVAITNLPQDGTTYTAQAQFGQGAELVTGSGEFVVYDGVGTSVTVTGLEKATTYHFAVFEYSPSGTGPDYLITAGKWLASSKATLSAPTSQISQVFALNIQSTQAQINFLKGAGSSRIFIMREGSAVDVEPQDLTSYSSGNNIFGVTSAQIGTGNYVVNIGTTSIITVSSLKPGTEYHIAAFEFNGSSGPVYLRPGAIHSFTTVAAADPTPTQPSQTAVFELVDGNKLTFKWTNGNGANRIVVARKSNAVAFAPANGTSYTANAAFSVGTDLGNNQHVVYNGNASSVTITNLEPSTTYHFAVYEYNGTGSSIAYLNTPLVADRSTANIPATKSTGLNVTPVTSSNSMNLSWINGSGDGRLVVVREDNPVNGMPAALTPYNANTTFRSGSQIAAGEYVVYAGSGNSVTVTGLTAGRSYHLSIFEYNGTDAPVYNTSDALTGSMILQILPVKWLYATVQETNGAALLKWGTAQEVNTDHFVVDKSTNGVHFSSMATITAAGNSDLNHHYSYTDHSYTDRTVYYRIKQVDKDGQFSYSKVLLLSLKQSQDIRILQNPVSGQLRLQLTSEPAGTLVSIADAGGRVVCIGKSNGSELAIPVHHLKSGIYYATVQDRSGKRVILPFVKQ